MIRPLGVLIILAWACDRRDRVAPVSSPVAATPAAPLVPADSLLYETADGSQIWFAEGRSARDSSGAPCFERSVEIRRDTSVLKVPLLFTARVPTMLDRRHLRAELMRDCRVMGIYRVELATGRPTKIR